jgi:hypothetical protein
MSRYRTSSAYRATPPEQLWPSQATRKRIAAERREQEARQLRLDAAELDRKWAAYCAQREAEAEAVA